MTIKLSRHARRRAKLYKIPEDTIFRILENMELLQGKHEIIREVEGSKYPLKIVVDIKSDIVTVITSSSKKRETKMNIYYDKEVDAVYIKFGNKTPEGVNEISEGVNIDTTSEGNIVGIEILDASKKMDIKTIFSYKLELDKKILTPKTA